MNAFSPLARALAMRRLLTNGGMWGAYGQLIVVSGPIFTGFALWMGLEAADIALIVSAVAFAGLVQPISSFLTGKLRNQKSFIIRAGFIEISINVSVILLPLLVAPTKNRFVFAAIMTLAGTLSGNLLAPLFNSWFSRILPPESRARFMGRRLILVNLAAVVAGYGAGKFIDSTGSTYISFIIPYFTAWLVGVGGYIALIRIPYPVIPRPEGRLTLRGTFIDPFKIKPFRNLVIFHVLLIVGALISDPFYNVFMIQRLGVSYATLGVYNAIVLGVGVGGYSVWGSLAGRFGSKPVLQFLMIPRFMLPFVWIVLTPANHQIILPIIMVLNGVVFSGLNVAINTLLFGSVPEHGNRPAFFAVWAFAASLTTAIASAIGGFIVRGTADATFGFIGLEFDGIKLAFLISGLVLLIPALAARFVSDSGAKPVRHVLGQVLRGNAFGFAYNSFLFSRTTETKTRAKATRAMGRSRSPMAVDHLVKALDDVEPAVREQAVKALGDTRSEDAVEYLARTLSDDESNLQAEAATSLGKLKHPKGIDPLFRALDSRDTRVAISAARALGDIGGKAVVQRLWDKLNEKPTKELLPSLVESLSKLHDRRVAIPAIDAISTYKSAVIRLQLLNAACRALGARNLFYNLLAKNDYELAEKLDQMLQTMGRRIIRNASERTGQADELYQELKTSLADGDYARFPGLASKLADALEIRHPIAVVARDTLRKFADHEINRAERPEIFSIVCLGIIADTFMV